MEANKAMKHMSVCVKSFLRDLHLLWCPAYCCWWGWDVAQVWTLLCFDTSRGQRVRPVSGPAPQWEEWLTVSGGVSPRQQLHSEGEDTCWGSWYDVVTSRSVSSIYQTSINMDDFDNYEVEEVWFSCLLNRNTIFNQRMNEFSKF